jgi:hypothetical protein
MIFWYKAMKIEPEISLLTKEVWEREDHHEEMYLSTVLMRVSRNFILYIILNLSYIISSSPRIIVYTKPAYTNIHSICIPTQVHTHSCTKSGVLIRAWICLYICSSLNELPSKFSWTVHFLHTLFPNRIVLFNLNKFLPAAASVCVWTTNSTTCGGYKHML